MRVRLSWCVWRVVVVFLVVLGAAACGRDGNPVQVVWEASGVQVTRIDLPLGGDRRSFVVSEYLLEGQEGAMEGGRQFRDRMVLTTEFDGREGPLYGYAVHGYLSRTYAGGFVQALRLHGRMEPPTGNPGEALVIGRVYPMGHGGAMNNRVLFMDRFEIRLDPVSGRISAKGL